MANPFEVRVPDVFQALMAYDTSYDRTKKNYREEADRAAVAKAAPSIASGNYQNALAQLFSGGGNVNAGLAVAGLGNDQRNFAYRQQQDARQQGNVDRQFTEGQRQFNAGIEGARVPAGFEQTPTGLRPKPGGPEDPAYLRQKTEATDKGRQMSITDITKLSEEGQKYADLGRFSTTFKPEYAGYRASVIGDIANAAGRNLPESVVGKNVAEGANWWQGYDRYKNVVRNDLFGSALTATEQAAFQRADITPGMEPKQIERNLALQQKIVENGLKRKAAAMVQAGYDPKAIGAAYGVDLGGLGVNTQRRGAPTQPAQQPAQFTDGATATNPQTGQKMIFRGGQWQPIP